jgi:hypothetical protein
MVLQVDAEGLHVPRRAFGDRSEVVTVTLKLIGHLGHLLGGVVGADGDFAAARLQSHADLADIRNGGFRRLVQFP